MTLSPDGHLWLKNIEEKAREIRVLLNTYGGNEINLANVHLTSVIFEAKHFIEAFESQLYGEHNGKEMDSKSY